MVAKRGKKSSGKPKTLKAKTLTRAQAKKVRGGLNPQPLPPRWAPPELKKDPINKI
jgi:hypothetical protein